MSCDLGLERNFAITVMANKTRKERAAPGGHTSPPRAGFPRQYVRKKEQLVLFTVLLIHFAAPLRAIRYTIQNNIHLQAPLEL